MRARKEAEKLSSSSGEDTDPEPSTEFLRQKLKLYFVLCFSYILWGLIPLWLHWLPAAPLVVVGLRFLLAPLLLVIPILGLSFVCRSCKRSVRIYLNESTLKMSFLNRSLALPRIAFIGLTSVLFAIAIDAYTIGLTSLPTSVAATLSFMYPLFNVFGEFCIERGTKCDTSRNWRSLSFLASFAVAGAALASVRDWSASGTLFYNVTFPLIFSILWAVFLIMTARDRSKHKKETHRADRIRLDLIKVALQLGFAGLLNLILISLIAPAQTSSVFTFFGFILTSDIQWTSEAVYSMLSLAVISTAIPYVLFHWAMGQEAALGKKKHALSSTDANILESVEVITAVVVSMILSMTLPSTQQWMGLVFLLVTVGTMLKVIGGKQES